MLQLNLELEKLFSVLEKNKAQKVLIQLPDGLKPKAKDIQEKIKKKFPKIRLTFWAGSCYGACDVPNVSGYDLLVQFGHSEWR
ncbi:MAG TPA: diphthamide synthesis protein [Candidatus Nanoarchaeia archaeon]|nr:diphthamide synthesis protein [Candidatus Nanoarchaeia archaeon]